MEKGYIIEKTGKYYDYIEKLSKIPLSKMPKLNDIGINDADIQSCSKEIKKLKKEGIFDGSIIDYLCFLSTYYFLFLIAQEFEENQTLTNEYCYDNLTPTRKFEIFIPFWNNAFKSPAFFNNLLRLYLKNGKYILNAPLIEKKMKNLNDENKINLKLELAGSLNTIYYMFQNFKIDQMSAMDKAKLFLKLKNIG